MHNLCANVIIKNNYIRINGKNICETYFFLKEIDKILFFPLSLWHQTYQSILFYGHSLQNRFSNRSASQESRHIAV